MERDSHESLVPNKIAEAYSETYQSSEIAHFAKIGDGLNSIFDVWKGSEYVSLVIAKLSNVDSKLISRMQLAFCISEHHKNERIIIY